jgi:hypothetical protein
VVSIAHPGESTERADHDSDVGNDTHDQNCVVGHIDLTEVLDDLVEKPDDTGECAATVDATQMLKNGSAAKAEPERRPLYRTC